VAAATAGQRPIGRAAVPDRSVVAPPS